MKNKTKSNGCHNCGSSNTYATAEYIVCRKCGYRREYVLEILDKLKEEKEETK